ncbi:hypothetical protein F4677DRAFT_451368 [Hypoxylon crocopeplum]|nr:hypothetical protein F4677DRAFT_451368 [Hypoxylon crocopeplum]
MKTSLILATIVTILSVIEAAPSDSERASASLNKDQAAVDEDNMTRVQKQRVRDKETDVGTNIALRAADDIFNKRTNCQQYPCDEHTDCRVIGCKGGCQYDEYDRLRCYA